MDEAAQLHEKMLAMNEALLLGSLRQHELAEAAEKLNEQLRAEITEREGPFARKRGTLIAPCSSWVPWPSIPVMPRV